ncbi:MAG TPA: hypothetical protein ENK25_05930 [Bacteroidetes bacterium]|nr:hypothetical protein [Bacteroidota bacterium]
MTGTYHIWPITIGLIVAYIFSLAAMRLGIYRLSTHRRFWNVLLLLNFLTTVLIGTLLTLQVNYKFTLPGEDTWMLIHVDTGIAMTIIGIFHLGWHLWFFASLFHRKKKGHKKTTVTGGVIRQVEKTELSSQDIKPGKTDVLPVLSLGFTAMITQLVLLRAFVSVFQGNELVIGIILGNWMLLTGLGARLGRAAPAMKAPGNFLFSGLLWLGSLPVITLFLLFFLKNIVFIPGSLIGLFAVFLSSLVLLLPFCFLAGYAFSFYTWYLSEKYTANLTGRTYSWEAFGSLTGGFLFSFILVFLLKPFQTLGIVLLADIIVAGILVKRKQKYFKAIPWLGLTFLLVIALYVFPVDLFSIRFLHPHQKILAHQETPFGSLVVSKTGDQTNMYENHVLVANTLNPVENEEDVHYAMLQRKKPKKVLLISGGIAGTLDEILKYPIQRVDYVEINPWIIRLARKYFHLPENSKVRIIIRDARRYVPGSKEKYDVVLVNVPPPLTAQLNRYYTVDFFHALKKILTPRGVISLRLPASPNYLGKQETDINGLLYASLKKAFPYVLIVPGEKNYFLASEKPLSLKIANLVQQRGIQNKYISPYYIQDDLLQMRNEQIMDQLTPAKKLNTDMNPEGYFHQISLWLSYFRFKTQFLFIALGFLFLILIFRSRPVSIGIFAGGLAASSMEVLLLFAFQTVYGYVYLMTGMIITVFMAGIALGALSEKYFSNLAPLKNFICIELLLALGALLLPLLVILLKSIAVVPLLGQLILIVYTFIFAFLVGRLFNLGSQIQKGDVSHISSSLYSADLAGGALGALAVSAILLPLTGITGTALITAGTCLAAAGYLMGIAKNT